MFDIAHRPTARRTRDAARPAALLLAAALALPALAAPGAALAVGEGSAGAPLPSLDEMERQGAVVGRVILEIHNIFDPENPEERRRLYRLANRLHRTTRERVIEQQLLFKSGDRLSRRAVEESARLLRQARYLYDAQIVPVRYAGQTVDLAVVTHDVWTLDAGLGLGRSGGANTTRAVLQDSNFLGTGKSVSLERRATVDRRSSSIAYEDSNLLGAHALLALSYAANSDGHARLFQLAEPFYSLDSRWAAGLLSSTDHRVDALYALGHSFVRFHHDVDLFSVNGGLSDGLVDGWARRWSAGFTYQRDRFAPTRQHPMPAGLPDERTLSYPWVAFDVVQDEFEAAHNLDQIERTEDLHLGRQLHLRLGLSSSVFGASRNAAVFDGAASAGWKPAPGQTLLFADALSGRWGRENAENVVDSASARYYWRNFGPHLFFVGVEGTVAHRLDPELQLLLGGDTGLRGYPLRYQDGDRNLLVTVEQRFYTDYYPFRLCRVGAAVFFDAGRTWSGHSGRAPNFGLLRDAGLGLRLSMSRSGLGNVIHFDLAFPFDGDATIKRAQWLVRTKASF